MNKVQKSKVANKKSASSQCCQAPGRLNRKDETRSKISKDKAMGEAHNVFGAAKMRGRLPTPSSENKQEAKDAKWIASKKQAKDTYKWYPELLKIAKEYGFPDAFGTVDLKHKIFADSFEATPIIQGSRRLYAFSSRIRALKAWKTIRKDKKKRSQAAKKAWVTIRKNKSARS